MAKCGCSGSVCNCVVQAGDGITVTGAGTAANPYIVAADPADVVTVADTSTVDMTKTGNVITSAVIVDPVAGNTLVAGPAGLSVPCESIQDCVGAALDDGLVYDDAANQMRVRLSTQAGNTLVFGPDNGVYNPASPVTIGCGLTNGGLGEIIVDTLPFASLTRRNCDDDSDEAGTSPLPGPDTAGMAIYCDANGNIRTMPEKFTEVAGANINDAFVPGITVLPFTTASIAMTLTNPSDQYCMCGYATFAFIPGISGDAGTVVAMNHEIDFGTGGGFVAQTGAVMDNRGKNANSGALGRPEFSTPICLDPGETKTIQHRVRYVRFTGDNGGNVLITSTAKSIRWVGTNL